MAKKVHVCQTCGAEYTEKRLFESRCPRCHKVEIVGEVENPEPTLKIELQFLAIFIMILLILLVVNDLGLFG